MASYTTVDFESYGPILCVFTLVSVIMNMIFLNRVNGKSYRIKFFLAKRKWHILENPKIIECVNTALTIVCHSLFLIAPITLLFWGAGLMIRRIEQEQTPVGGIAVILIGFSILAFLFGVFKIKWNRFRVSVVSIICIVISMVLLVAYQVVVVFLDSTISFFAISSIFLTANGIILVLIAFINSGVEGSSIKHLINDSF